MLVLFNNSIVWMVTNLPLFFRSSSFFSQVLAGYSQRSNTDRWCSSFHNFLCSLTRSWYLFMFQISSIVDQKKRNSLFGIFSFCFLLSDPDLGPEFGGLLEFYSHRGDYVFHFFRKIFVCAYKIHSVSMRTSLQRSANNEKPAKKSNSLTE